MPFYVNTQNSGPETIDMGDTGSSAAKCLLPAVIAVTLRWNADGDEWEYNRHDLTGWHVMTTGDEHDWNPPIRVRRILLSDGSNESRRLCYDLAGNGEQQARDVKYRYQRAISNYFRTNEMHDLHVTKLYLDQITPSGNDYATYIVLYG
ncbi:MAG: hypothetical protein IMZ53_14920 [Thermoplasmata archaeon]|nr:hypothetical protein [Thermoplasmata archaeon]MBE3141866.1 hypothetical protein [Thermoplasmata archaeon]